MVADYFLARLPLFYVFLSGIGFSLQTLIIKILAEHGFHASFQCIFFRGVIQLLLASIFVYKDQDRLNGKGPSLFGDSTNVKFWLFMRSFVGFGGIAFSFLAVELIPIGDATVLVMLSPMLTSILSYIFLGEAWRLPEFIGTTMSLIGVVLVAKPPAIFGGSSPNNTSFYTGVAYGLISCVSAAFAYMCVRVLGTTAKMPWANVCFSQALGQIILAFPFLYLFGQKLRFDLPLLQYFMLILAGSIGAWSQILMTIGMQREKSAAATAMRMSDVAFGFLWQVLFTSDALSLLSVGGAVLVTCSILVIVVSKEAPSTTKAADMSTVELAQMHSTIRSIADSFEDSYDLEDGFADSDGEGDGEIGHGSPDRRKALDDLRISAAHWEGQRANIDEEDNVGDDMDTTAHDPAGLQRAQKPAEESSSTAAYLSRVMAARSPLFTQERQEIGSAAREAKGTEARHQYSTLSQGEL